MKRKKMRPVRAWVLVSDRGAMHRTQHWGDFLYAAWVRQADAQGWVRNPEGWKAVKVEIREVPRKTKRKRKP